MSSIGFSGIGSGLPIDDIIKATVNAEAVPLQRMDAQRKLANEQLSAFSTLASRLDGLSSAMRKLKGSENFELLKSTSSNTSLFTATADHRAGATNGQYNIKVLSEAQAYRWTSAPVDKDDQLTGNFTLGDTTFDIEAVLEDGKRSLNDLREYINKEHGKDVSASLVNVNDTTARLVLTAKTTGEAGRLNIEATNLATDTALSSQPYYSQVESTGFIDADTNFTGAKLTVNGEAFEANSLGALSDAINAHSAFSGKIKAEVITNQAGEKRLEIRNLQRDGELNISFTDFDPAVDLDNSFSASNTGLLDAHIQIDGIDVYSNTNSFSDVISGVSINLAQGASLQGNNAASLNVSRDDAEIKGRIDQFLKAYNDVVIHLNEAKKGPLAKEGIIRAVEDTLRDVLYTPTGGDGNLGNTLNALGIGTYVERGWVPGAGSNSRNGTLEITDQSRFNDVLNDDFEKLAFIFGEADTGYAARFEQAANQLTTELIPMRSKGLSAEVRRIETRMEDTNRRLDLLEERLYKQFNAVDAMIAQMNSTGSYITQQFEGLPGYTRK